MTNAEVFEECGKIFDRLVAFAGSDGLFFAFMAETVEKSPCGDDDRFGVNGYGLIGTDRASFDAGYGVALGVDGEDFAFKEGEVGLVAEDFLHERGVCVFADLGAESLDSWPFSGSDTAIVGEGVVGGDSHLAAKGIDFAGDVAFCGAANAAVAGEVTDAVEAEGDAERFDAQSRGGEGGFDTGVSGTDNDDVEVFHLKLYCDRLPFACPEPSRHLLER